MMQEIPNDKTEDDSFDEAFEPPSERWAPLGASSSPPPSFADKVKTSEEHRLKELEEEQDQLNSSLLSLTTHFAQVQFRLQQICKASGEEKEILLKDLEEFAFKGCPDLNDAKRVRTWHSNDPCETTPEHDAFMEQQREKQIQLIRQLKEQLEDLERFAYETGEAGLPSSDVMEKQKVIIDQLRNRMDLDIDQFDSLSAEELQWQVDQAVKRLTNPMKVKEQLVQQLKTQITDLERFIDFLQGEGAVAGNLVPCTCGPEKANLENCLLHGPKKLAQMKSFGFDQPVKKDRRSSTDKMMNQTMTLIQMYILTQFGCRSKKFHKNELKKTTQGCHWGDLRAALELAIQTVCNVATKFQNYQRPATLNPYNSDEEDVEDIFDHCPEELVAAVRKIFCPALRDLLQHGLLSTNSLSEKGAARIGCFSARSAKHVDDNASPGHAWDAILKYYEMKHGREYSDAPVRKLSQSFNLDNIGGRAVTSKQMLLSTVDNIVATHTRLRRSNDAMFKAFVSAALNHKKLVGWLRMILRTKEIVDECYAPWSYVAKTNFDDACGALEKLNQFSFNLPVDLAVRPFQNIKDVF